MNTGSRFETHPWKLKQSGLHHEDLGAAESLFALSNGHLGVRGNLDEGDPYGLSGTYLNSVYESRPLPQAEAVYGFPESGETVVNVTDGKVLRLLVDDEPFDIRYGRVISHERELDFRTGILTRNVLWEAPAGKRVRINSERLVSLSQRAIMAIKYRVEAVDVPLRVVVQSELIANQEMQEPVDDPRTSAVLRISLDPLLSEGADARALLAHQTRTIQLRVVAAVDHMLEGSGHRPELKVSEDWARVTFSELLEPGGALQVKKFVAYGWSQERSLPALRDQVEAALYGAVQTGWAGLNEEQKNCLDGFWESADVRVGGNPLIQQAVRLGLFHVLQSAIRAGRRPIPAKGLTGPGYDGHTFWDTEMFILPVLTATAPDAARDALRWRRSTLDLARTRAEQLGWSGSAFPWRTIVGRECSGYWPAGTAAVQVNGDIVLAALRYVLWTGAEEFERSCALPILIETARFWLGTGYYDHTGAFHIDGGTGPDEYSALSDDNTYTNLIAAENLLGAAECAERYGIGLEPEEIDNWRRAANSMSLPTDEQGIPEQARGYHRREVWDFDLTLCEEAYPLLLYRHYMDLYRKQIVKQADLILALHQFGDRFTPVEKARTFAHYEPLTVRDSSLSACTQAVIAAEVGHLDLAYDYLAEGALMDLVDREQNTRDGVHLGAMAGMWISLVAGFGGMRDRESKLLFRPQLPGAITSLCFTVMWRNTPIKVEVGGDTVTYTAIGNKEPVAVYHGDEQLQLRPGIPVVRKTVRIEPLTERPAQPPGRKPLAARGPSQEFST